MSKLFRLKEWLTVADAAQHLAIVFGEAVSEADVLRFALDGELKLSVNFVNGARARAGKLVPIADATYEDVPMLKAEGLVRMYRGPTIYSDGVETHILELESEVASLQGVFDLPMIGGERHDVEHRFQALIGGPRITMQSLDGAFVTAGDDVICQLQADHDDNEFVSGSTAGLVRLENEIEVNKVGQAEAKELLAQHYEHRRIFLDKRMARPSERFYPAGGLPSDCLYVVRTGALSDFVELANEEPARAEKPLGTTERNTLLTIIAALCKDAGYDSSRHAKTAGLIQSTAIGMGVSIGESTIEGHLKKIPDALASRMK